MTDIADSLGIAQSNITKASKSLSHYGLIERFHLKRNKKNIILKPTDKGKHVYTAIYENEVSGVFIPFFESLNNFSDAEISNFKKSIDMLSGSWGDFVDMGLEKIEDN